MLPKPLTKKKFYLFLLALIVAVLVYAFLFHLLSKNAAEVSLLNAEVGAIEEKRKEASSVQELLQSTEDERRNLDSFFAEETRIVEFISDLEELGAISGATMEIVAVDTLPLDGVEDMKEINATLDTYGSWDDVYHFLSLLESMPYFISIKSASFERHSETGNLEWKSIITITAPVTL